MSKPILPADLTEKIEDLIEKGMSSIDIYDLLTDDADFNTELEDQNTSEYRIFSNNDINLFSDGRKVSILPVVGWIESRISL